MQNVLDQINFIARSYSRFRVLEELSSEKELHRDELKERIDASRTTIQRHLDRLVERDWVQKRGRKYQLTAVGEFVAEEFINLGDVVEVSDRLKPFLRWVSADEFDCDLSLLTDADLLIAEPGDPWAMINEHVKKIEQMNQGKFLLPFTGLHAVKASNERIVHHGAQCELVVSPSVAVKYKSDPNYSELIGQSTSTGRNEVFEYDGNIPFGVALINDTVQIIVAEGDEPRAMLESKDEEVYDWAAEVYTSYKNQSDRITE